MTIQTTYTIGQETALAGQVVDLQNGWDKNYVAADAIAMGRAVIQDAGGDRVCALAAAAGVLVGVAKLSSKPNDGEAVGYVAGDVVPVMDYGRIWVEAVGAVTKNAPAYVITTAGANQGKFTATPNALGSIGKFATSGTDALVELDVSLAIKGEQGEAGA